MFVLIGKCVVKYIRMELKVCFIGHNELYYSKSREKLNQVIKEQLDLGVRQFQIGTHGEFDKIALECCKQFRATYEDIIIEVVLTSLNQIKPRQVNDLFEKVTYIPYKEEVTVFYDIECEHFKRKIIASNHKMVDNCDVLICYVDEARKHSGAKEVMNYAKRLGKKIINIFPD